MSPASWWYFINQMNWELLRESVSWQQRGVGLSRIWTRRRSEWNRLTSHYLRILGSLVVLLFPSIYLPLLDASAFYIPSIIHQEQMNISKGSGLASYVPPARCPVCFITLICLACLLLLRPINLPGMVAGVYVYYLLCFEKCYLSVMMLTPPRFFAIHQPGWLWAPLPVRVFLSAALFQ